jgi:chromosome segregation ATPase
MSDNTDWRLIVLASQKAQIAAEAAVASAQLLESEVGGRLTSVEARLGGIEGRMSNLFAGQASHERAIMRIAEIQAGHTVLLNEHTDRLTRIEGRLDGIEGRLTVETGQLKDIETRITRMETLLTDIARKLDA